MRQKNWKNNRAKKAFVRAAQSQVFGCAGNKHQFLSLRFNSHRNIVSYERNLRGDYEGLAEQIHGIFKPGKDFKKYSLNDDQFAACLVRFKGAARRAALQIQKDMRMIRMAGLEPELRIIGEKGYRSSNIVNVERPHIDGGNSRLGRFIVTYCGPGTENVLLKDLSSRRMKGQFSVAIKKSAQPFSFPAGTFVRHACYARGEGLVSLVKPSVHYAPRVKRKHLKMTLVSV